MAAGDSAAREAARQRDLADELARRAGIATEMARNFDAAARSENRLAQTLLELEPLGYTLLTDRRWPGSKFANVDLILIGPGGVIIVDAKSWRDVTISDGHLYRGTNDVTDEVAQLADLVYTTQRSLAEIGLAAGEVRAFAAFTNKGVVRSDIYGVTLLSEAATITEIARLGTRLSQQQIADRPRRGRRALPADVERPDRDRRHHPPAGHGPRDRARRHPGRPGDRRRRAGATHLRADPHRADRGSASRADRGLDGVPASRAGSHRAPHLHRARPHPRRRRNRQDRRRPAPRRPHRPHDRRTRARHHVRAHAAEGHGVADGAPRPRRRRPHRLPQRARIRVRRAHQPPRPDRDRGGDRRPDLQGSLGSRRQGLPARQDRPDAGLLAGRDPLRAQGPRPDRLPRLRASCRGSGGSVRSTPSSARWSGASTATTRSPCRNARSSTGRT